MADALLVADQSIGSLFVVPFSPRTSESLSNASLLGDATRQPLQHVSDRSFNQRLAIAELNGGNWDLVAPPSQSNGSPRRNRRSLSARHALEQIAANRRVKETAQQFRLEMTWIEKNRVQFADNWVALLGSKLLAMGSSAKEVFDATAGTSPAPLIVHLEGEPLPFAGW